jgi:hypothetical protein
MFCLLLITQESIRFLLKLRNFEQYYADFGFFHTPKVPAIRTYHRCLRRTVLGAELAR